MDAISRISALKPSERSESDQQELVHAYGGLRMVLNLLILLISYNPNNDMGQIAQYICRNKPETHPDFFQHFRADPEPRLAASVRLVHIRTTIAQSLTNVHSNNTPVRCVKQEETPNMGPK